MLPALRLNRRVLQTVKTAVLRSIGAERLEFWLWTIARARELSIHVLQREIPRCSSMHEILSTHGTTNVPSEDDFAHFAFDALNY